MRTKAVDSPVQKNIRKMHESIRMRQGIAEQAYEYAQAEFKRLSAELAAELEELQKRCKHPNGTSGASVDAWSKCEDCGLDESV